MENLPIIPIITFLVGILFTVSLNIGSNLLTPKVQSWMETRSIKVRARTAKQLRSQIIFVTAVHSSPYRAGMFAFVSLIILIMLIGTSLFLMSLTGVIATIVIPVYTLNPNSYTLLTAVMLGISVLPTGAALVFTYKLLFIAIHIGTFEEYLPAAQKRLAVLEQVDQQKREHSPTSANE